MFTVKDLCVFYTYKKEKHYILKDVNFSLNQGDCLGVIGKSGDGKSTLAKSLLKLFDSNITLEKGTIELNNKEISHKDRGTKISLLFQNPNSYLNPLMKIGPQISEMLIYHHKYKKNIAKEKSLKFMKDVGIENNEEVYNLYPHELSGGMQQRLCLCMTLICKPEILILDECTSFLDKESREIILNIIKKLQKEYNFTIILISHDFNEISFICNKIAILKKGQIIEFGEINEVINSPIHPYTMEIFYDYLRYYKNIEYINFTHEDGDDCIRYISKTHFVKPIKEVTINYEYNYSLIKEQLYDTIRNKQIRHLL